MRVFEHSFESPAQNLALDEVLLENAEAGLSGECLRLWESPGPFVVLGLTQRVNEHILVDACAADAVQIHRRCTAGGCVVQAPGCLNFAFVLKMDREGCDTIHGSYRTILGWIARALSYLGHDAALAGISDLAIDSQKVSGNAQKRKRRHFLHHGTILYGFDSSLCARYLVEPGKQPEYRAGRGHAAFLGAASADRMELIAAVSSVFHERNPEGPSPEELRQCRELAHAKYESPGWIYKR
jgi:lipoate-protein ligase A